jgi:hypothetical protein
MTEEAEATTLAGRVETHGRPYPHLLEKAILLATIAAAIAAGQWMWANIDASPTLLWAASLCGLPLAATMTAEALGRIVQRVHVGRN